MQLKDKNILITGASRGIGKAIAHCLAAHQANLVLVARNTDHLKELQQSLSTQTNCFIFPYDLTQLEGISQLHQQIVQTMGPLDALINNAGYGAHRSVLKGTLMDWQNTLNLNLLAPMLLSQLCLPAMIQQGEGAIVNIASVAGQMGLKDSAAYSASKFGIRGFSQSLFEEVREHKIKVACICPGFVDTELVPPLKQFDRAKMIQTEDVASAVEYVLLSSANQCPVEITLRPQQAPFLSI